jgi:hypothetical protein
MSRFVVAAWPTPSNLRRSFRRDLRLLKVVFPAKQGTFFRSGPKVKDRARWSHKNYNGWVSLQRSAGEVVVIEIGGRPRDTTRWQLLHALVGFVVRHFGDEIVAIQIQFPNRA